MRDDDLEFLAKSKQGRRFLGDMFRKFGLFGQPVISDEKTGNYREGRRSVVLEIADQLFTIDTKCFTVIVEEWKEREEHERRSSESERERAERGADGRPQYYVPIDRKDSGRRDS